MHLLVWHTCGTAQPVLRGPARSTAALSDISSRYHLAKKVMCKDCKDPARTATMTRCSRPACLAVSGSQYGRVFLPPDSRRLGPDWPQVVCHTAGVSLPELWRWRAVHCVALGMLQGGWRWTDLLHLGQHFW